jgi:hypothetical protein
MSTLIMPAAGQSSRFPNMRPKWLLTMPDGSLMFEKSLSLLDLSQFDRMIIICLKEHIEQYINIEFLQSILNKIHSNFEICILDNPTKSQAETISYAIEKCGIDGPFFTKDCDNKFSVQWDGGDEISVIDLSEFESLVNARNKSYVSIDHLSNVTNIVEKQVISNYFCCGGFGFKSAKEFIKHYSFIEKENEVYVSHIVYSMLISGINFKANYSTKYVDWGTLSDYQRYMDSFYTIFCDVDGVLMINGSKFGKDGWDTKPIEQNIRALIDLQNEDRLFLIITSSRPESEIPRISSILRSFGLSPQKYIMNLPHSKRYLINDYSNTNRYPTAIAINLERDAVNLKNFF